jgi:hypothetical protein
MSCAILTSERIEALLAGRLADPDRAALKEHLASPCESCLDALAGVEGERILAALAGKGVELTPAEADQVFAAALPAPAPARTAEPETTSIWERIAQWMGGSAWRPALSIAVILLVAAPTVWLGLRPGSNAGRWDGIKGAPAGEQAAKASLIGIIGGHYLGKPFVARRAAMNEKMRPGEVLLVRFRLSTVAAVHLQISGPKASLSVWPDGRADTEPQPSMLPPGEHALIANQQVLSIRAEEYGSPARVTLMASPRPFPMDLVPLLGRLAQDPPALAARCPGCVVEVLEVVPPPEGVQPEKDWQ